MVAFPDRSLGMVTRILLMLAAGFSTAHCALASEARPGLFLPGAFVPPAGSGTVEAGLLYVSSCSGDYCGGGFVGVVRGEVSVARGLSASVFWGPDIFPVPAVGIVFAPLQEDRIRAGLFADGWRWVNKSGGDDVWAGIHTLLLGPTVDVGARSWRLDASVPLLGVKHEFGPWSVTVNGEDDHVYAVLPVAYAEVGVRWEYDRGWLRLGGLADPHLSWHHTMGAWALDLAAGAWVDQPGEARFGYGQAIAVGLAYQFGGEKDRATPKQ